jgi:Golgi phosphoprotein 3 (GPP34)
MSHDLLLAEELLLLSLDDEKGSNQARSSLGPGLGGALLIELTEMGALRVDGEGNLVAGGPRPEDPILGEVLDAVAAADRPRGAKHWVHQLPGQLKPLRQRLAERLVDRGILDEERKALLGMTVSRRYPEQDPAPEQALRERLLGALTGDGEPGPRDAELICLLRPFELIAKNVPREHRKEAKRRAKEIADTGPVNSAVSQAVAEVQAAITVAIAASAAASAANS